MIFSRNLLVPSILGAQNLRHIAYISGMTMDQLNALYASATAAMAAGEWGNAILYLMQMQARLASMPNIERALADAGSQKISWNASQIDALIAQCRRQKAAEAVTASTTGIWGTTKITYKRAT